MKISIILIGKTKDSWIEEGIEEYLKRLSPYAMLHYEELQESKAKERQVIMKEDAEKLLRKRDPNAIHWLLDPKGVQYSSEDFAAHVLKEPKALGQPVQLFIAGAFGLPEEMKKEFTHMLSLSSLTFTHQMTRVILLEQAYRAFTILQGKSYHY